MIYLNETSLTPQQTHFIRALLAGRREMSEREAAVRIETLGLTCLMLPCVVACLSPFYANVDFQLKDDLIRRSSDYVSAFFQRGGYTSCCLTNALDNIQILLPTKGNGLMYRDLEDLLICLHQRFSAHFALDLFIGLGTEADQFSEVSRSALEASEMLAYKYQHADRGVISMVNTTRFKHYSVYGEDIMFSRVIGRFQDGDLSGMAARLDELVESIRYRPSVSKSAIKRTFVELAVKIIHVASNADVDVDSLIGDLDIYGWIMRQNHTEIMTEWLLNLSAQLMEKMNIQQKTEEKEIIRQALDFITQHLGDPALSLQTVSEAVGLSAPYFSQLFKMEKGIGLNNYITESRILRAQQMLKETDLRSQDIALQLGFATASYFGRVFKKSTGVTPGDYRLQSRYSLGDAPL